MTNTDFLPKDYKPATNTGNYTKFEKGETRIRILGASVVWYEYFNTENKPVRSKEAFASTPNISDKSKVKEFWAFPVWNYKTEQIEVCEITQATIKKTIFTLYKDSDYGDPKLYDIKINRDGDGMDTEYTILWGVPKPIEKFIIDEYEKSNINLDALFTWGNPFEWNKTESINIEDIPF